MRRFRLRGGRLMTPSVVVSMLALFVALAGTGWAQEAVPLAKRALTADKAKVATNALEAERPDGDAGRGHPRAGHRCCDAQRPDGCADSRHARPDGHARGWPLHDSLDRLEHRPPRRHTSTPVRSAFQVNARSTAVGTRLWALRRSRPTGRSPTARAGSSRSSQRVATPFPPTAPYGSSARRCRSDVYLRTKGAR